MRTLRLTRCIRVLSVFAGAAAAPPARAQSHLPATFANWGEETLRMIRSELYLPASRLYADKLEANGDPSGPAFMWGCGVMLSALNGAATCDPKYRPWLSEYVDALDVYWNDEGPVPGYDVLPCPKPVDRYYDDNVWMVLALTETHRLLGEPDDLERARRAMAYVLSGEDETLGGGIYWRESDKASKNVCSNAPSALACYTLFSLTGEPRYREAGDRILDWTIATFRDPDDWLMWDSVNLDGRFDETKWSYNTALTIRALLARSALLEDARAAQRLRDDAARMGEVAVRQWVDPETGAFTDGAAFSHLLAEALLALDEGQPDRPFTPTVVQALTYLHDHGRDPTGHYPHRWNANGREPAGPITLLDQASAARAFFLAAEALSSDE